MLRSTRNAHSCRIVPIRFFVITAMLTALLGGCASQTTTSGQRYWPAGIGSLKAGASASAVEATLPDDVSVRQPKTSVNATERAFSGVWRGWLCKGKQCDAKLAVEEITRDGATVVYSAASHLSGDPFTQRGPARIDRNELVMTLRTGSTLVARLRNPSEMEVMLSRKTGELFAYGVLTNKPFQFTRMSERVPTPAKSEGKPVSLELIRFRPNGTGPFPTVVMSHGSTTRSNIGVTWVNPDLASFFTSRGWQIVFPQRRGRGRSDGVYDEGYKSDKSGYSCDPRLSLPGFDRAIADTRAVVDYLKDHDDVDASQLLMSGVSRGGILSVAFAGQHPGDVTGVVNFVGGWMSDSCKTVDQINPPIFERGATYPKPTLWLYGENDPFYTIKHSRNNFDRFIAKGGTGEFKVYEVPEGSGHWLHWHSGLWENAVDAYLQRIR